MQYRVILVEDLPAFLTLLRELLQGRNGHSQQLDHDGSGDVGGDTQSKQGGIAEGATAEQVNVAQPVVVAANIKS